MYGAYAKFRGAFSKLANVNLLIFVKVSLRHC